MPGIRYIEHSVNRQDLTGQQFGALHVWFYAYNNARGQVCWYCECTCGHTKVITSRDLLSGDTKSCGCQRGRKGKPKLSKNLIGQQFGYLTVESFAEMKGHMGRWNCRCICGNTVIRYTVNLKSDAFSSCGCRKNTKHGLRYVPGYDAWKSMIHRCYNPKNISYCRYGAIGVTVCERWRHDPKAFLEDVGERPGPEYSLDRYPNPFGNYEVGNVRWATRDEQDSNRRTPLQTITIDGVTRTVGEWATLQGMNATLINYRLKQGKSAHDAVFLPVKPYRKRS